MEINSKPEVLHLMVRLPPTKPYEKVTINERSIGNLNLNDLVSAFFYHIFLLISLFFFFYYFATLDKENK